MEDKYEALDLDSTIGNITLSNGQSLDIPKLSVSKIIKIVKFLGIDGSKIYAECREILMDESLEDLEKFAVVLETLDEKQLVRIFSICLDLKDEEVLKFDPNEMLEILLEYVEKTDLNKTFLLISKLMKKMFNKEFPESPSAWLNQMKENQLKRIQEKQKLNQEVEKQTKKEKESKVS